MSWTSVFRQRGVAVALEKVEAAWRVTLVTGDRPFLFASVAGTLSSFGMNILKAEAFSNSQGTVLDTFHVCRSARTLELNPSEIDRLRVTVERVVLGRADVRAASAEPAESRGAQPQFAGGRRRCRSIRRRRIARR